MNKGANLKKKVLTLNKKGRSPIKNKGFDFQYQARSSTELVKLYQIKRENALNERKNKTMQDQAPETHKRKYPMSTTLDASEGKNRLNSIQSKECTQKQLQNRLPMRKNLTHSIGSSQRKDHNSLPMTRTMTQAEGCSQKQDQNKLLGLGTMAQTETSIQEQQNPKKIKRKPICPAMCLDQFLDKQGIHVEKENQPNIQPMNEDVGSMPSPIFGGNNYITADDIDGNGHEVGDNDTNNCAESGKLEKKKTRGKTTCKKIHARNLEEREEVTFDKGQAVGPTNKRVSDLSNFLGTIARNPGFITLLYTNWQAVPGDNKKRMCDYVNSKFIIPEDGKKWVMDSIRDAWKRHKRHIKKMHFDKFDTTEDMLKNRPTEIPEVQFCKLIKYWSLPAVQSMCRINSENRRKQKWRHRMGPVNFGRVRVALRATKENNEDPTKSELFIATRTSSKGKQVDLETQAAISELQNRQNSGETDEDAFQAVFGKEQPGRVRCYGRSITTSFLKRDEEICKIKQQHAKEVVSLKDDIQEMKEEMQGLRHLVKVLVQQNHTGLSSEDLEALLRPRQSSPPDANSARGVTSQHLPHSSGSTHVPNHEKENFGNAFGAEGNRNI